MIFIRDKEVVILVKEVKVIDYKVVVIIKKHVEIIIKRVAIIFEVIIWEDYHLVLIYQVFKAVSSNF